MAEFDRKVNIWIRERLIPRLVENEPDAEFSISRPTESFFVSDLFFVKVRTQESGDKSAVVKLPLRNPEVDIVLEYDGLFANEILLYKQIAHNHEEDYPKCFVAGKDTTFKNVIVLEDVRSRGYGVCTKKVNLELDYIVASLRSIARFHGHTYAVKEKDPTRFRDIVKSIHTVRYREDVPDKRIGNVIDFNAQRFVQAYRARHRDSDFTTSMGKVFQSAFKNILVKCAKPIEPLATIIHGDCTINNMLYRKRNDGKMEAMLIDFGLVMHSSPAIDVAAFLYLTCKREDLRDRIEEMYFAYHDSLTECLKEHGIWDSNKYSRQIFWQEYRERAIFGYLAAALFFKHVMMMYERDNVIPEWSPEMNERFFDTDKGHEFMEHMVDIFDDMRTAGFLDHWVKQ